VPVNRQVRPGRHTAAMSKRHMLTAHVGTVVAACHACNPDGPWETVRDWLVPMLPRARPLPVPVDSLARTMVPPGVLIGFGLDLGPAFALVTREQVERWGVGIDTAAASALANLRRAAVACGPGVVRRSSVDGVPIAVVQSGLGIASTLILVPECIERLLGPGPHLLLAPMRDMLVALPASTDRRFVAWLAAEWEALDPNHLHLGAFCLGGGSISAESLEDAVANA
jgi:hypothetical protein